MDKSTNLSELNVQETALENSAITRGIRSTSDGLLCSVQWSDIEAGCDGVRVVLTQPDGKEKTVFERTDEGSQEGNAALFGLCDTDLKVVVVNGLEETSIEAIDPEFKAAAKALAKESKGYVSVIATGDDAVAALEEHIEGEELCQRVIFAGPKGKVNEVDLTSLDLKEGRMLSGLVFWGDRLCLLVADACAGADVAVVDLSAKDKTPQALLTRGAQRFALNAAFPAACATPEGLLLGSAALNDSSMMLGDWGAELILLMQDRWDLLVGHPRFSPEGLKVPTAVQGPGFGESENCAIQAITTQSSGKKTTTYAVVQGFDGEVMDDRTAIIPDFLEYRDKARLFVSTDLVDWSEIEISLPEDCGAVTCIAGTATGLAIGHEGAGADGKPITYITLK